MLSCRTASSWVVIPNSRPLLRKEDPETTRNYENYVFKTSEMLLCQHIELARTHPEAEMMMQVVFWLKEILHMEFYLWVLIAVTL